MNEKLKWTGEVTPEGLPVVKVDGNNMSFGRIVTSVSRTLGLNLGDIVLLHDSVEDQWLAEFTHISGAKAYFTLLADIDSKM